MKRMLTLVLAALLLLSSFALNVQAEATAAAEEASFVLAEDGFTTDLCYTRPYLLSLKPTTEMSVLWFMKEEGQGVVRFGESEDLGTAVEAESFTLEGLRTSATPEGYSDIPEENPDLPVFQQVAVLSDLKPATTYYYQVISQVGDKREVSKVYNFTTAPEEGSDFSFILLSDLQLKKESPATVKEAGKTQPDFILYPGDLQNCPWKSGEWFPVEGTFMKEEEVGKSWFEIMQQEEDGAELLSYAPIFPCPGNHEIDDQRIGSDKEIAADLNNYSIKVYQQIFRTLYPEQKAEHGGKHWYSADWGDLHISSIAALRWAAWDANEAPGWPMFESLEADSEQMLWLKEDLANSTKPYKWVVMHFHMMNRGEDGQIGLAVPQADPDNADMVIYPEGDNGQNVLRPLYEENGVCAVCFGHSHVYERYLVEGVHYIEAASIGNNYRDPADPYHPTGIKPEVEFNDFRSFLHVTGTPEGLQAEGIQASLPESGEGEIGQVFDSFLIEAR